MQPFVGDKADTQPFLTVLAQLEEDADLAIPDYSITVLIPVGAISKGVNWTELALEIRDWFQQQKKCFPSWNIKAPRYTLAIHATNNDR
jgi:hypothetical protein